MLKALMKTVMTDPFINLSSDSGFIDVTDGLQGEVGGKMEPTTMHKNLWMTWPFVIDFTVDFNTQHASGYDMSGVPGGDFFNELYSSCDFLL